MLKIPLLLNGGILLTASPLGEEEPGPKGAERGGYLPIPRRDARAGEWEFITKKSILKRGGSTSVCHTQLIYKKTIVEYVKIPIEELKLFLANVSDNIIKKIPSK